MHPWAAKQRACGIPISGNLQTAAGQSPGQVAPALESALAWAGDWIGDLQGPTLLLLWFYESGTEEMSLFTKPGALVQPQDRTHISVPQPPPSWQWHFIAGRAWWELVRFEVPLPKAYNNKLLCLIFLVQTLWDQLSLPEIPRNFMRRNLDAVK